MIADVDESIQAWKELIENMAEATYAAGKFI